MATANGELGIGIIGAGSLARSTPAPWRTSGRPARWRPRRGRRNASPASRPSSAAPAITDYRELLADPAVDVVCIALPHNDHAEAAIAAAQAGKAVMLEKPMAPTLADCDAIVQAVSRDRRAVHGGPPVPIHGRLPGGVRA